MLSLIMEIAKWQPEKRSSFAEGLEGFMKLREVPEKPLDELMELRHDAMSVHTHPFKPGVQQIWWDVIRNRSFTLLYDYPGVNTTMEKYNYYSKIVEICDIECVDCIEVIDMLALAGRPYGGWEPYGGWKPPADLPSIQLEIATWPRENTDKMFEYTVNYIEKESKKGPFPVAADWMSVNNPEFMRKGLHVWWDVRCNRSFGLCMNFTRIDNIPGYAEEYYPAKSIFEVEHHGLIEFRELIPIARNPQFKRWR